MNPTFCPWSAQNVYFPGVPAPGGGGGVNGILHFFPRGGGVNGGFTPKTPPKNGGVDEGVGIWSGPARQ